MPSPVSTSFGISFLQRSVQCGQRPASGSLPDPRWARNIAGEGQAFFFIKGAFRRDRGEQRLSVRVLRICVDSLRSVELHDTSQIHDHDPVADVLDDAEVMGDENISQVKLLLQAAEEVDDLCLDGNVQCGYRLVADDDLRSMERARAMFTRCLWPPENSWG